MFVVNRSVAIIKPRQAFLEWANSVSDEEHQFSIFDLSNEYNIILLPEYDSKEQAEAILKEQCRAIFEIELSGWITDKSKWPENRTYETFLQWFDVEFHSMVFDPVADIIEKERFEY